MPKPTSYWVVTFTLKTWAEAQAAGGNIVGFRSSSRGGFRRMALGDHVLCYLTGISRFVAVQEVVSGIFVSKSPIWKDDYLPLRVSVMDIVRLEPETAVPVSELRSDLSIFRNLKRPSAWGVHFRTSPKKWKEADGKVVVSALREAEKNPVRRALQGRGRRM